MPRNVTYSDQFKKQIVMLKKNGKTTSQLVREYNISKPTVYKWIKEYDNSGSFKAIDNRSQNQNDLINLEKEIKQLKMENDILKQAALISRR